MFKEFKEFISKGNVIDLAVGIIVGGAFGKIINSFANDIIMPILGLFLGKINFEGLKLILKSGDSTTPELALTYGIFIQNVVNFLITAFAIFLVIKAINKFRKTKKEEQKESTIDQQLLTEIRDLLKK
ncbi:MAG: large-conductance mechanosensitive channel protein MscL [Sebaldella sp.]|nr:large-conductance mechanosensitive channel protein MscL [Sebaldella sp.]